MRIPGIFLPVVAKKLYFTRTKRSITLRLDDFGLLGFLGRRMRSSRGCLARSDHGAPVAKWLLWPFGASHRYDHSLRLAGSCSWGGVEAEGVIYVTDSKNFQILHAFQENLVNLVCGMALHSMRCFLTFFNILGGTAFARGCGGAAAAGGAHRRRAQGSHSRAACGNPSE